MRLTTPAGALVVAGGGLIDDARVKRLNMTVTAPRLASGANTAQGVSGTLTATGDDRLRARLALSARAANAGEAKADAVTLVLNADAPYGRDDKLTGSLTASGVLNAASVTAAGWTGEGASLRLDLSGALAGTYAAPRYRGVTALAVNAETARGPGVGLAGAGLTAASQTLELAYDQTGLTARGPVAGRAVAGSGAVEVGGRRLWLDALTVRGSGDVSLTPAGFNAALAGAAEGQGGFGAADASWTRSPTPPCARPWPAWASTHRVCRSPWTRPGRV